MPKRWALALLVVSAAAYAPAARAQTADDEEICGRIANVVCGDRDLGLCFRRPTLWDFVGKACTGHIQTLIEMEREAKAEQGKQPAAGSAGPSTGKSSAKPQAQRVGHSCGGILRAGPGTDSKKLASLAEGDRVEVLEDPGVWFNEYKWYRVSTKAGVGYHWGGIFRTEGATKLEGTIASCW